MFKDHEPPKELGDGRLDRSWENGTGPGYPRSVNGTEVEKDGSGT